MTERELVDAVATRMHFPKKSTRDLLRAAFAAIEEGLAKSGRFAYPGFGVFTRRTRKARQVRHPARQEVVKIPAHRVVHFRASKQFQRHL